MKLIELICVVTVLAILASFSALAVVNTARRLKWKLAYIGTFHNARIGSAVKEDFSQIDFQLEDGSYQAVLRWK